MHMLDTLQGYLEAIRQAAQATTASLYIPAPIGSDASSFLCHLGDHAPVQELLDEETAASFTRDYLAKVDDNSSAILEIVDSRSENARIISIRIDLLSRHIEAGQHLVDKPERRQSVQGWSQTDGARLWLGLGWQDARRQPLVASIYGQEAFADQKCDTEALIRHLALSSPIAWAFNWCAAWHQDSLSRMPGRTEFQSLFNRLFVQSVARETSLALLLINPDDFATVNQRLGRKQGDAVLTELADRLNSNLRHTDMAFRYGGAVFAVLLPGACGAAARSVADKLRHALSQSPYAEKAVHLAFSMGMASYDPKQPDRAATDAGELLYWADNAINQAKLAGGGRTVIWDPLGNATVVGSLDRLSGIFTADTEKDYRNMLLLWETVAFIASQTEGDTIAREFVGRIGDMFKPFRVALLTGSGPQIRLLAEFTTDAKSAWTLPADQSNKRLALSEVHLQLFEQVKERRQVERMRLGIQVGAARKSLIAYAIPMMAAGSYQGCLYIEMLEIETRLDSSDLVFLSALANQVANALAHAYLASRWKQEKERESSQLKQEVRGLREALQNSKMVFRSAQMHAVMEGLLKVAATDATVLITGESGTGKEMLAKSLHELSQRKDRPFITVDCGAISPTLLEAELFGRAKGAYTGADSASPGRILQGEGGTLFLDEVGELPLDVQAKLLRFVQEKEIMPVGASQSRRVDVRIVAATNRDLAEEVRLGRFRQDLYYRLQVFVVEAVPLRSRPDDILPLARYFLEKFCVQYQKGRLSLNSEAEVALLSYPWPGNVRELQNQILKAVVMCSGETIGVHDLQLPSRTKQESLSGSSVPAQTQIPITPHQPLMSSQEFERQNALAPIEMELTGDPWQDLRRELQTQVQRVLVQGKTKFEPLGRWLGEDLVLLADAIHQGVARRASVHLGMAETTYRRQLQKVQQDQASGRFNRVLEWRRIGPILSQLLDSLDGTSEQNLNELIRDALLQEVINQLPGQDKTAAELMGVTLPTYRRWREMAGA